MAEAALPDGPIAYLNGELVPASECRLPIYDLGIVLGAAVTDFLRTFGGEPFRIDDHVARLHRSCRYARIDLTMTPAETAAVSRRLIAHNLPHAAGQQLGLVYYVTAGENQLYAGAAGLGAAPTPTVVQHTFPLPVGLWRDYFRSGVHCVTPPVRHWPPGALSAKIKNRNRLHMWIGEQQAHLVDPAAVAVYLDADGHLTETGGSNIVVYRDGTVWSPRGRNILWGVSLTVLTEILAELEVPFAETDLHEYDVLNADEVWLPTTPYCLAPVTRFNGVAVGAGKPGALWRRIIDRWSDLVGTDLYAEIAG